MNYKKIPLVKIFSFLILGLLICSTTCFAELPAFLDAEEPQGSSLLQRDIKVPIGFTDDIVHHVVVLAGTTLNEISHKISQKRQEIGLPSSIPLEQQDKFLQTFWKTTKDIIVNAPMPGKISKILVTHGQQVTEKNPIYILEAMKMETQINSPCSGEIKSLCVAENEVISNGSALYVLLPNPLNWEDDNTTQIIENKNLLIPFFPWASIERPTPPSSSPPNGGEQNETFSALTKSEKIQSKVESVPLPSVSLKKTATSEVVHVTPKEDIPINQSPASSPALMKGPHFPTTIEQEEPQNLHVPSLLSSRGLHHPVRGKVSNEFFHSSFDFGATHLRSGRTEEGSFSSTVRPERRLQRSRSRRIERRALNSHLSSFGGLAEVVAIKKATKLDCDGAQAPCNDDLRRKLLPDVTFAEASIVFPHVIDRFYTKNIILKQVHSCPKLIQVIKKHRHYERSEAIQGSKKYRLPWIASAPTVLRNDDGELLRTIVKLFQHDSVLGSINLPRKYALKSELSFSKSKTLLREKFIRKVHDNLSSSLLTWAKWTGVLIVLSKLIFVLMTMSAYLLRRYSIFKVTYSAFYQLQKMIYLNAASFNAYRSIEKKMTSNISYAIYSQKKPLKRYCT